MSSSGSDRRRHTRYELLAQVHVKRSKVDYVLELQNVSVSGALVHFGSLEAPSWAQMGRSVELAIVHPIDHDTIEVSGTIVRVQTLPTGISFAVEFSSLTEATAQAVNRLVAIGRPQPPPLPR